MMRPLLEVTARWREDQPDGFAVTLSFDTPSLGEHFAKQLLVAFDGLDRNARWSPEVALGHLRDVGRMPEDQRNETIRRRAVGIVAWLQERGHIAADEHNGVAWHQVGLGSQPPAAPPAVVASAPPTEPVLKAAKKAKPAKKAARPRAASRERASPVAKEKSAKKSRKKA
ncbi:MAG TPA: hypothetical protein VF765_00985 [Polyangiaceae bacterium]